MEFKGRGLARGLGLRSGETIVWNSKGARHVLKAETASRVVLTTQRHDIYMTALRKAVTGIAKKVARDPSATLDGRDQRVLALAPTDMRAEVLADQGFKLTRVQRGPAQKLKYHLVVPAKKLDLFTKIFGPGVSTMMPGKGHSMYLHQGLVWETYDVHGSQKIRPTSRTIYPVMLTGQEARRMDVLGVAMKKAIQATDVQGDLKGSGRPSFWPMSPEQTSTGNTCTTTHHRAPIGPRGRDWVWLDNLQRSIGKLATSGALMPFGKRGPFKDAKNPLATKPPPRVVQ